MENKHLPKLFILGLTFAGLTAGLLRWAETETAAQKQDSVLADNVWTGATWFVEHHRRKLDQPHGLEQR